MGDLASRVQSSLGGNDIPQKHLKATEEAVKYLAQMASERGVMIKVKKS